MKTKNIFILLIFALLVNNTEVFCGPPDVTNNDILDAEEMEKLQLIKDSLLLKAEIIGKEAGLLADSFRFIDDFNLLDISDFTTFNEIIIDENGTIKVLTDSGLITLSQTDLEGIISPLIPGGIDIKRQEITRWGKNVTIDEGERVYADVVVIGGDVKVNGFIKGDIVVVGGNIYVNPSGYVDGDAVAIGGKVRKDEGAKVTGSSISFTFPFMIIPGSVYQTIQGIMFLIMIVSIIFSALAVSLLNKPVNRITEKLINRPVKSFIFGYITYIGVFLVWLLLLVSVIGIPLALFGEPLAFVLLIIFAYASVNQVAGIKLFKQQSSYKSFWYGSLITTGFPCFLLFLGFITNSLVLFVFNMIFFGFFIFIIIPFGLGAASLARFGFPPRTKAKKDSDGKITTTPVVQ